MSRERRFELPDFEDIESTCTYDTYCNGDFHCEDCKYKKGSDNLNIYEKTMTILTAAIDNELGPFDWADITVHKEEGTGSITFTGPTLHERDWKPGAFRGAEDAFFAKMFRVRDMIRNCGFTATLSRFEADKLCPYSEATISINFEGGEL